MKCPRFTFVYVIIFLVVLIIISAVVAMLVSRPQIKGCVTSSTKLCTDIAGKMIEKGGTVIDAVIAGLLCEGVFLPGSCGLGGGFVLVMYAKGLGKYVLNAMPITPKCVPKTVSEKDELPLGGPTSVSVPGELRGYLELYKRFGKLDWEDLFLPAIELCETGVPVDNYFEMLLKKKADIIYNNPDLRKIFYDEHSKSTLVSGQQFKMPELANTLRIISKEGADALYNGSLTQKFIDDIPGGLIQISDMKNYRPRWQTPVNTRIGNSELLTAPVPATGHMLAFFIKVLNGTLSKDGYDYSNWKIIVEAFKFMFALGSKLEDTPSGHKMAQIIISDAMTEKIKQKLITEDLTHQMPEFYLSEYSSRRAPQGNLHTSHFCILTQDFAISVTNSLNSEFGAGIMSRRTGIILNNDMSNFSNVTFTNETRYHLKNINRVKSGLQPMNPLCPALLLDRDGSIRLVIGGTGGPRIITGVALSIVKHVIFNANIQTAVSQYRLHHQLTPMNLFLEELFVNDMKLIKYLEHVGHNISFHRPEGLETVTAIANNTFNGITGVSDLRRGPGKVRYLY